MYINEKNIANKLDFNLSSVEEIGRHLGLRLKQQRIAKRWTQLELAERSGLDVGTIKNLENKGQCALLNLIKITVALDRVNDLSDLFQLKISSIAEMEQLEKIRQKKMRRRAR